MVDSDHVFAAMDPHEIGRKCAGRASIGYQL
jgi:hypothetical protein